MQGGQNQLSRYGAISKAYPFVLGKVYFLTSTSENLQSRTQRDFPVDVDGEARIFTTWASVIAATTAGNGDAIAVSPYFTTAPTLAQIATMDANGVSCFQMGYSYGDGSYYASKASAAFTTPGVSLFQINGRIQVLSVLGEVTTVVQGQSTNVKLTMVPTVGGSVDICSNGDANAQAVGNEFSITGLFSDAMQFSSPAAIGRLPMGSASSPLTQFIMLPAGTLKLVAGAASTGATKWKIVYKPIDPGAFVSAL